MPREYIPSRHARKHIMDYPVMLQMLAGIFHETYRRTLEGESFPYNERQIAGIRWEHSHPPGAVGGMTRP